MKITKEIGNKKGFTLIELIVVMAIIGILVLLAVPKMMGYTKEAKFTKLVSDTKQLENASERYYMDNQDWPRLDDDAYTAEQLSEFAQRIYDSTGKIIELDVNGKYYDIDYNKLKKYVYKHDNETNYIIQNPVGSVFYLDELTEKGINRIVEKGNTSIEEEFSYSEKYPGETVLEISNPTIKVSDASLFKEKTYALLYTNYGDSEAGKHELIYIEKIDITNNLIYPKDFPTLITTATNVVLYNVLYQPGTLNISETSIIKAKAFDGISGGVIVIKTNELVVDGTISADESGYRGGNKISGMTKATGYRGEGLLGGFGVRTQSAYYGGGGGGVYKEILGNWFVGGAGGGGNYTAGATGNRVGKSGGVGAPAISTNTTLSYQRAIFGGGGGAGSSENDKSGAGSYSGYGGAGGGAIIIYADKISGSGTISSKGQQGGVATAQLGTGGGGAGGTIVLYTNEVSESLNINVTGGDRTKMIADTTLYSGAGGNGIIYKVNSASNIIQMSPTNATIVP